MRLLLNKPWRKASGKQVGRVVTNEGQGFCTSDSTNTPSGLGEVSVEACRLASGVLDCKPGKVG